MTVSSETRTAGPYNGNDVTTTFSFAFKVFETTDIRVLITDSNGVETEATITTDYTVTLNGDQNASPGGSISYPVSGSPLATGSTLKIVSDVPALQEIDLVNGGGFYAQTIEELVDRAIIAVQDAKEALGRALKFRAGGGAQTVDLPDLEAGKVLRVNNAGTAFELQDLGSSTLQVPADESVTVAKMYSSATMRLFGRTTAGAGAGEQLTISSFFLSMFQLANAAALRTLAGATSIGGDLFTAASAAAARSTLGLGSLATASSVTASQVPDGFVVNRAYAETTNETQLTSVIPVDNTKPQNTEGIEILSASITPGSATNRIRVTVKVPVYNSGVTIEAAIALFRDSGADALDATATTVGGSNSRHMTLVFEHCPATTSSTTYKVRAGASANSGYVNIAAENFGSLSRASIVLEEIKAS